MSANSLSTSRGALEGVVISSGMRSLTMRQVARIGGVLYLIIFLCGIFAEFFVRSGLIVRGDAMLTANNILASEGLFRANIAADLIMIVADVAIALVFLVLLRPVSSSLAMLAAFFRLTQAAVLGANLLNLVFALQLITSPSADSRASQALALMFLDGHATGYRIALAFFAFSILTLGYLIVKADYFPSVLGFLLAIAAVAYLGDTFADLLMTNYATFQPIFDMVVLPAAFIGELALCVWLSGIRRARPGGRYAPERNRYRRRAACEFISSRLITIQRVSSNRNIIVNNSYGRFYPTHRTPTSSKGETK